MTSFGGHGGGEGVSTPAPSRPQDTYVVAPADDEPLVARWADAVERAVYGNEVVDQEVETRVAQLAPSRDETSAARVGDRDRTGLRSKGT